MRYDFFLIWGNALQQTEKIINKIRKDKNFSIVAILRHPIKMRMQKFVNSVYAIDSTPRKHLRAKTQYLRNSNKCCIFVLVQNLDPKEDYFGEGKFRTIQCNKVVELKNNIRNSFNPPLFENQNIRIASLNKGVSHEHCVHASDNEKQVDHLLKLFDLPNLNHFKRYDNCMYEIPWHINISKNPLPKNEKLDKLFISIINQGPVHISDSLHLKYIKGNKQPYIDYFYNNFYFGLGNIEDHFPKSFDILINSYNPNYTGLNGKISKIIINSDNVILDGAHRAALLYHLGYEKISCIQI
ncbi:MAG: hypothetical protein OXF95_00040 [Rhodobacteraceae bacterium]|nr:hypothetical protein [Paracoccaceae bacterium]